MHGTFRKIEEIQDILENGILASIIRNDKLLSKYLAEVGVWNLSQDISLKDYINFY